jgi:mycothiol synthase
MPPVATDVKIRSLGSASPEHERDAALRLRRVLDEELSPGDPPMGPVEHLGDLYEGDDVVVVSHLAAWQDGRVVGIVRTERHLKGGNENVVELDVEVDADHRRRGIGTALLRAALDEVTAAPGAGSIDSLMGWEVLNDATTGFWTAAGCPQRYLERVSRLVLPDVDPEQMAQWVTRAKERASDYSIVQWIDRCPDDLLDTFAVARTALNDAPLDSLDVQDEVWTPELVRGREDRLQARSMHVLVDAAVHRDSGVIGGYTEVVLVPERPQMAFQDDTGVLAAHRERGLGRWLKASMWQRLRRDHPEARTIDTANAESNAAMLAINVAMGFRPHLTYAAWQAPLADVRARLSDVDA